MGVVAIEPLRVYLETTVFNFYFDADREGHEDVVRLLEAIRAGRFEGYASTFVMDELKRAPEPKRSKPKRSNMMALTDKYGITILHSTPNVERLSELYVTNGVIPPSHLLDSEHIAMASAYELDVIVSYNFEHINRAKTRNLTAIINRQEGYDGVKICTAREVLSDD